MDGLEENVNRNADDITRTKKDVTSLNRELQRLDERTDKLQEQIEERIFEEMREREQRKLNVVLHGVKEPAESVDSNWKRVEEDKDTCAKIFREVKIRTRKSDIRFCRRVGQRSRDPQPMVKGLYTEEERNHILGKARELQDSRYSEVNIVPDLTKKQRSEENTMRDKVEQRNKELSRENREKNLKWLVVGRRGERRIIKGQDREGATSRPTWDGGRERDNHIKRRERDGRDERRSPRQREDERREGRNSGGQHRREEERQTGAKKKEGGAWSRNTANRDEDRRREGREEDTGHRYSNWRVNRRRPSREDRERTISVESERQVGKRGRKSGSDSDMEVDHQKKKLTKH
jgi:hypothetical protein